MSRPVYTPLFDSFFEGSIMREEVETRFVMLALIRLAWRPRSGGIVDIDPLMFANSINIPLDRVERSIERLMSPDPHSGSDEHDGRRIIPLDPKRPQRGWQLVNWPKYQRMMTLVNDAARKREERWTSELSENVRARPKTSDLVQNGEKRRHDTIRNETKRKERSEQGSASQGEAERVDSLPSGVTPDHAGSHEVTPGHDESRSVTLEPGPGAARRSFVPPSAEEVRAHVAEKGYTFDPEAFFAFYASKGWKVGAQGMRDWRAACVTWQKREAAKLEVPAAPSRLKPMTADERARALAVSRAMAEPQEPVTKTGTELMLKEQRASFAMDVFGQGVREAMQTPEQRREVQRELAEKIDEREDTKHWVRGTPLGPPVPVDVPLAPPIGDGGNGKVKP